MLEVRNIGKRFGPVVALSDVSLALHEGEVLALLGDNGAGKSTLVKILSGYYKPDEGELRLAGQSVQFADPQAARAAGIETIYQDLALFGNLDVPANVFAGQERVGEGWRGWFGLVDRRAMAQAASEAVAGMAVAIPRLDEPVEAFSGGQRQCIAIARAILWGRHVVIMDEPTAALGVRETGKVLDLIRSLRSRGLSVVLIAHNMEHVLQVAGRAIVLRHGQRRGEVAISGPDDRAAHDEIVRMML